MGIKLMVQVAADRSSVPACVSARSFQLPISPAAMQYRMIALRKKIAVEKGQERLFEQYRYFFYITNDRTSTPEQIVFSANDRCDQENLIEQLKNGVRSMRHPLDNLHSNWAYMVMASLAWTLKGKKT